MELENNVFVLDLSKLDKEGDKSLREFAQREELEEKDIIKIIYAEANRIGEKSEVKVTFKMIDGDDDSFRVIVEPVNTSRYKGTVIYPFKSVKSNSFEITFDDVCSKITLVNKKEEYKTMSVTIDFVALDLFAMTYNKAKELLKNISDRKEDNGYIEGADSICFRHFGVKINAKKDENGNILPDELLYSIDVYNKEEFFKEFYFETQKVAERVEMPKEEKKQEEKQVEKQEEKVEVEQPKHETIEVVDENEEKDNIIEFNKAALEKKVVSQDDIIRPEEEVNADVDDIEIEIELPEEESKNQESEEEKRNREIEELLNEEKRQQELLDKKIQAKLQELKVTRKSSEETKPANKEVLEKVEVKEPDGYKSYDIESYKGIKEQGKSELCVYLGQSKDEVRKYFGGMPKEVRDYEEMELYDIFYAYYDEQDKCTGIGIYNQEIYKDKIALYFLGENLITMKYKDIVALIKNNDYNAIEDEDGIISLKYGISIDPKEEDDYQNMICDVIHIFKEGYYDEVYENF